MSDIVIECNTCVGEQRGIFFGPGGEQVDATLIRGAADVEYCIDSDCDACYLLQRPELS